jgi:putative flippase GtrA
MIKRFNQITNKITAVLIGILINAMFFLVLVKYFTLAGGIFAIVSGYAFNYLIQKKYPHQKPLIKAARLGFLGFNIFVTIAGIIIYLIFYLALQNILN